jgi:hypothetical protein
MSDGRDGFRVVGCDASQPGGYFHRKGYRIVVPSSPGLMSLTPELTFIFADEDAPQLPAIAASSELKGGWPGPTLSPVIHGIVRIAQHAGPESVPSGLRFAAAECRAKAWIG